MSKGIRVSSLAKDLGVPSKDILDKLKLEGLSDAAPNHMSMLSIGLAESVREWFKDGEGGVSTAVQTAPPVEKITKPRAPRKKKVAVTTPDSEAVAPAESTEAAEAAPTAERPATKPKGRSKAVEPAPDAEDIQPAVSGTLPTEPSPAPVEVSPVVELSAAPATEPTAIEPPAATHATIAVPPTVDPSDISSTTSTTSAPAPAPAHHPAANRLNAPPVNRPTITMANTANRPTPPQHVPERKTITPAPQMLAPTKAAISGPRIVRVEKPDVVSAPRTRRPGGPGAGNNEQSFTQARPLAGRGVKSAATDDDEDAEKKKAGAKGAGRTNSTRRRGLDGRRGDADTKIKEFTEADLIARRDALNAATATRASFDRHLRQTQNRGLHQQAKSAVQLGQPVSVEEPITVKSLSAALGVKTNELMGKLMKQGVFATINQTLERDTAAALALDYGLELTIAEQSTLEELLEQEIDLREAARAPDQLNVRPPVVTILGHVDHGKTSLLDKIRNANVAAGEAGGITQHTAAWMVDVGEGDARKRVTFIDTPGHQAFTSMRARGANMTDVVVLVVGAVEGVMPQTIESINHARAAGVPIVVAMNKIDRAEANPDMVLGQLAAQNLNPVEWGGTTEVVRTSALTGQGVKELIEILDYQSQLLELKADPTSPARGTVVESRVDPGLGPIATVLVQDGTLRVGDTLISGPGFGRIRSLLNDRGEMIQEAGPSTPVIVSGLSQLPSAGEKFYVVDDIDRARAIAEERATLSRQNQLANQNKVTLENLFATMKASDVQTINLIIKGDVQGSVETLVSTVTGQNTEEVKVRVIHSGVGPITESDVELAMATKTKATDNKVSIIGFHVVPDESARSLAEHNHVEIRLYRVIYEIFDDLKKALSGMLEPEVRQKLHGHAEIRQVFKFSKVGSIAGCIVTDGHIQRGSKIRLIRNGTVITEDLTIDTLKRIKDDVKEVKTGLECGIKLAGYDDIKQGDVLEAYVKEMIERTL